MENIPANHNKMFLSKVSFCFLYFLINSQSIPQVNAIIRQTVYGLIEFDGASRIDQ